MRVVGGRRSLKKQNPGRYAGDGGRGSVLGCPEEPPATPTGGRGQRVVCSVKSIHRLSATCFGQTSASELAESAAREIRDSAVRADRRAEHLWTALRWWCRLAVPSLHSPAVPAGRA